MTEELEDRRLYERGIEDVEMSFHNVEKANQSYESLTVRQEGSNVRVTSILRVPLLNMSTPEIMLVFLRNQHTLSCRGLRMSLPLILPSLPIMKQ